MLVIGLGEELRHLQQREIDAFVGHPLLAEEACQTKERRIDQEDEDAPLRQHRQPEGPGDERNGLQKGEAGFSRQAVIERFEDGRIAGVKTLGKQGQAGLLPQELVASAKWAGAVMLIKKVRTRPVKPIPETTTISAQAVNSSRPESQGLPPADSRQQGKKHRRGDEDEKGGQRKMAAGQRRGLQVAVGKGSERHRAGRQRAGHR